MQNLDIQVNMHGGEDRITAFVTGGFFGHDTSVREF